MPKALINDHCLAKTTDGVAGYALNLFEHWPSNTELNVSTFMRFELRHQGEQRNLNAALEPYELASLSQLAQRPKRGGSIVMHQISQAFYRHAFRSRSRVGRYQAILEPDHLPIATDKPTLTVCHDLSPLDHPHFCSPMEIKRWKTRLDVAKKFTTRWVSTSEFTKTRMIEKMGIHEDMIHVIPSAPRELPTHHDLSEEQLKEYQLPARYFLHVGPITSSLNLEFFIDVWASLDESIREACPLIFAGEPGFATNEFWNRLTQHPLADHIYETPIYSDIQLAGLISNATALLLGTSYGGFSVTMLEAMKLRCPVICSDIPAHHDTGGTAACFLPLNDAEAWRDAMNSVLNDESWRAALIKAGEKRAKKFTWKKTARQMHDCLAEMIKLYG